MTNTYITETATPFITTATASGVLTSPTALSAVISPIPAPKKGKKGDKYFKYTTESECASSSNKKMLTISSVNSHKSNPEMEEMIITS